jgi:hypothetical protein
MGRDGVVERCQDLVIEDHEIFEYRRDHDPIEARPQASDGHESMVPAGVAGW